MSYLFVEVSSPILYFYGQEGSGKSFLAKSIKLIFDPCKSGLILNKFLQDLYLNLSMQGVAFIDNFGKVNADVQDTFCLAYTDGSFSTRKKFTDGKTFTIQIKCPLILASLTIPAKIQPDFISRTGFFNIIKKEVIKSEYDLIKEINEVIPHVRGEILNLASEVLKIKDKFKPSNRTRYADFDMLAYAGCKIIYGDNKFYDKILDDRFYKNEKCLMGNNPEIIDFIQLIKDRQSYAFTMAQLKSSLYMFSNNNYILNIQPNNLSHTIKKFQEYIQDKEDIYIFEGNKLTNRNLPNGIPYFACTKQYLEDNNLDIDLLKSDKKMVSSLYKDHDKKVTNQAIDEIL